MLAPDRTSPGATVSQPTFSVSILMPAMQPRPVRLPRGHVRIRGAYVLADICAASQDLPVAPSPRHVVLVGFDGMQLLNLVGPAEMLDAATQLLGGGGRGYRVTIATPDGAPLRGSSGIRIAADATLGHVRSRTVDTLIVGGGMHVDEIVGDQRLVTGLRRVAPGARRVCSVCTGAFL